MSIREYRKNERGGAGVKFLLVMTGLFLIAHAGINYIPVAYDAESFKQDMQTAVVQGLAVPPNAGKPTDFVKGKLQRAATANNIPADAFMEVKQSGNSINAHVVYAQKVNILPFGIYKYQYHFDHTATPTGFLMKEER